MCIIFRALIWQDFFVVFLKSKILFSVCMWTTPPPFRNNTNEGSLKSAFLCVLALYGRSSKTAGLSHLFTSCPGQVDSQKFHFLLGKSIFFLRSEEKFQQCSEGEIGRNSKTNNPLFGNNNHFTLKQNIITNSVIDRRTQRSKKQKQKQKQKQK